MQRKSSSFSCHKAEFYTENIKLFNSLNRIFFICLHFFHLIWDKNFLSKNFRIFSLFTLHFLVFRVKYLKRQIKILPRSSSAKINWNCHAIFTKLLYVKKWIYDVRYVTGEETVKCEIILCSFTSEIRNEDGIL